MTGGADRVAHINSPPPSASVPRFKHTSWYMSDHSICLQYLLLLSLISVCVDFDEIENLFGISFAENLPKNCFRVVLWFGLFLRVHQAVSLVHGFTHDKSVPCLFSTCLDFFSAAVAKTLYDFNINAQKPKFYSSTVVYFTLADLLGNQ